MARKVEEWGESTDIAVLERLIDVAGKRLVDVGCGGGDLARTLAERGATVLAVEPDPAQAERNRAAPPIPGVTFDEARAEALPVEDGAFDGVIFGRSLHHVPKAAMGSALQEARRAISSSGFVYVMEPVMEGAFSAVLKPFHDETEVRRQAQEALAASAALFGEEHEIHYEIVVSFESYEVFTERFAGMSYNSYGADAVRSDTVRRLFESGRTTSGEYAFRQPMRINLFWASPQ
jgi:ubiquinone/menaquinone biosynthesis C-methylase UbiE